VGRKGHQVEEEKEKGMARGDIPKCERQEAALKKIDRIPSTAAIVAWADSVWAKVNELSSKLDAIESGRQAARDLLNRKGLKHTTIKNGRK